MYSAQSNLYLVYVADEGRGLGDLLDVTELDSGLYLVRTEQTRSQLYHAIKRVIAPRRLLVAPLADLPKFKGMKPGSTKKMKIMSG